MKTKFILIALIFAVFSSGCALLKAERRSDSGADAHAETRRPGIKADRRPQALITRLFKTAGSVTRRADSRFPEAIDEEALERQRLAEMSLGRELTDRQAYAVYEAHLIGFDEAGKNGLRARIGNYTPAQLREKNKILQKAGFSKKERGRLIRDGVAGEKWTALDTLETIGFRKLGIIAQNESAFQGYLNAQTESRVIQKSDAAKFRREVQDLWEQTKDYRFKEYIDKVLFAELKRNDW